MFTQGRLNRTINGALSALVLVNGRKKEITIKITIKIKRERIKRGVRAWGGGGRIFRIFLGRG
jgi:hypothetical protein